MDDFDPPRYSYKTASVNPQPEEISSQVEPYLRKNITEGSYRNVSHYLGTHFQLLREDFMAPLRRAIATYKESLEDGNTAQIPEFRVYLNAKFIEWERYFNENYTEREKIEFDVDYIGNRVNRNMFKLLVPGKCQQKTTETKDHLIYGTLLCFSDNNFKTVFFGIATQLPTTKKGFVDVRLLQDVPFLYKKSFTMLECTNYFHVYKVVLQALQNFRTFQFPLQRYIVDAENKNEAPAYVTSTLRFTLGNVRFKVADFSTWPSKEKLNLNATQYEAFKYALTSRLAIIQGPPGTGKTYVSVKIAETLIRNYETLRSASDGPILVVAYTNHALDQFLEALIPFTKQIIRLGQKCTNKNVGTFVYGGCKRDGKALATYYHRIEQVLQKSKVILKEIENILSFSEILDNRKYAKAKYGSQNVWLNEVSYDAFVAWLMGESLTEQQREERWDTTRKIACQNETNLYCKGRSKKEDDARYLRWRLSHHSEHIKLYYTRKINETNLTKLSYNNRWILYFHWITAYVANRAKELETNSANLDREWELLQQHKQEQDSENISEAVVVGMTTTGAAGRQHLLAKLRCPIVIVEEAAEALESHIVVSLTRHCKHLVLVGDHQQLRPSTSDHQIGTRYRLGISLFERMVLNQMRCSTLGVQHRMRPEISQLIVPAIYPNLKNHSSVCNLPDVVGIKHNVFFIHHEHAESATGKSLKNPHEAQYVLALARHLMQQGYKSDEITILATYRGQVDEIEQRRDKDVSLENVRVTTVDNYQGEENQIILLSLVRNNDNNSIGFLAIDNRVCVALSRARRGLFMIGNMDILCRNSKIWPKIRSALVSNKQLGSGLEIYCGKHPVEKAIAINPENFKNVCPLEVIRRKISKMRISSNHHY